MGTCRPAIASHNLRSIAHAVAQNRRLGAPDEDLELQVLRGLGDDLQHALAALGLRVRTYCPVGDLVAGMAYLVRRLLENTSNESFLQEQARGVPLEDPARRAVKEFVNEPLLELRRAPEREVLLEGLRTLDPDLPLRVPVWIGSERRDGDAIVSTDPGDPERVVALAAAATPADVDSAVEAAVARSRMGSAIGRPERAEILMRAAAWMRERRRA